VPDGNDTIRDLLAGFNSMQAQLGLTPMAGQTSFSMPTTPMPKLKSPGEVSQELMQLSTQQMETTVRAVQQTRMAPGPGVLGLSPVNMPDVGRPPSPANAAAGAYATQFQERMQDIQSRYLSPYQAQQFAGGMGQPGFMNLPSPIFQTAPSMGSFRPNITQPPPIPLAREAPMIPTPFTPPLPTPRFQTRTEMSYQQRALEDERMFAGAMAAAPAAANVLGTVAAGGAGAAIARGLGGRIGGAIGGARGRAIGQLGGTILGGVGGLMMGVGDLAEQGMERGVVEPIMRRRAMGRQLERISQNFVVGGADLNEETGRGLTTRAAVRLAGGMQQDVEQGQTAGFNMRDMMRMTGMAAQGGMLDMAQNSEQIRQQMRNVARGLQSFMQIAQEPDVRRAMQQMSAMRSMGLTIPETNVAMRNAQTFARMAGTTVQGLQEQAGMPGAMTFQQLGMTGGLGMQVGHAAAGLARQAVAGGAFTPAQLNMAGGQSGLTQTMTEAGAAGLGVNFPLLAMLERGGPGGQLSINRERAQQIMRGQLTLSQQAQMGAENVRTLGGESVITELSTRLNELRDELGRTLGAQGTTMLAMRQATNLMREVPGLSFGAALRQLGMSEQQARSIEVMGQSPQFWQNVRQQHETNIRQLRDDEAVRRENWQEKSSLSSRFGRWWNERGWTDRAGEMWRGAGQAISEWWTDRGAESQAAERGATFVGRNREVELANARQSASVRRFIESGGYQRYANRNQAELMRGTGRIMPTTGEALGGMWNTALGVGTAVASVYGGLFGGAAAGVGADFLRSNAPEQSNYVAALQARGGITGKLAEWAPSLAMAAGAGNIYESLRANVEGRGAAETGFMIQSGQRLSDKQVLSVAKDLRTAYREYGRAAGVKTEEGKDRMGTMVQAAVKRFEQNAAWYGDKAVMAGELKNDMIESLVASGESREVAEKFVNDKWNSGLGAVVLNQAKPLLSDKAKAAWAKTEKATGLEGKLAGSDLKQVQENAEKQIDEVKKATGFYAGWDASKESWASFKEQVTTGTPEETLMMAAIAQGAWGTEESEEGARLRDILNKKLGPERVMALRQKMSKQYETLKEQGGGRIEMFKEYGEILGKKGVTFKSATEQISEVAGKLKGAPAGVAIARGATQWREAGLGAFGEMFGKGGAEGTLKALAADPEQMRQLREQSPELAKLVESYQGAESPEARKEIQQKFLGRLFQQGGGGRKTGGTFGGKGVGGAAEAREREQMGVEAEIEEAIKKGKPGEAFAKSVGPFAKATGELHEATKDLKDTVQAARLLFKMPRTG